MDLKDKRALITGGTSGMGIATALAMADELTSRSRSAGSLTCASCPTSSLLATPAADHINGAIIHVDGGRTAV